LVLKKG